MEEQIIGYDILTNEDHELLVSNVMDKIKEGWKPIGGIAMVASGYKGRFDFVQNKPNEPFRKESTVVDTILYGQAIVKINKVKKGFI